MTATFAQIPFTGGTYSSSAQVLPVTTSLAISSNMGAPGPHSIAVATAGYYRLVANLQISGTVGSQAIFWFNQLLNGNSNIVNQYQLDILGNMVVSFETVVYCSSGTHLSLYITVSTGGSVILDSAFSAYSPSALFAYLID